MSGRSAPVRKGRNRPEPHSTSGPGRQRRSSTKARKSRHRRRMPKALAALTIGLAVCLVLLGAGLWSWGHSIADTTSPDPPYARLEIAHDDESARIFEHLAAQRLLSDARLALWYQRLRYPFFDVEPGVHWLERGRSAHDVLSQLGRRRDRAIKRVVLPEGWDSFQIAQRLATTGVCDAAAFLDAVHPKSTASAASREGYLYPATYEFHVNTSAESVAARLEREARRRFDSVFEEHAAPLTRLGQRLGLHAPELVKLASIVEKEAANRDEYGLIASVFLNRLSDPKFRPAKMLQSDPTAAYGCKVTPSLESCRGYSGRVTSSMLRDASNPYNTYRYPGLPPTAIGNPSTAALAAVLTAPATPYFFFVSPNGGRHQFSETLEEHERHFRPR